MNLCDSRRQISLCVRMQILKCLVFLYILYKVPSNALPHTSILNHSPPSQLSNAPLHRAARSTAKSSSVSTDLQSKFFLPQPTNVTVRSVNRSYVQVSWCYNYSQMSPSRLKKNLTFIIEVGEGESGSVFRPYATLSGDKLNCLYPVTSLHLYRFRVVATSSGLSNVSSPTRRIFADLGPSSPPTNVQVANKGTSSVTLSWKVAANAYSVLCIIYLSTDSEQILHQKQLLITQCGRGHFTVKNLNPHQVYYFCVSVSTVIETVCSNVVKATTESPSKRRSLSLFPNVHPKLAGQNTVKSLSVCMDLKNTSVLPRATNLVLLSINASHVLLSWRYNYSQIFPSQLIKNLSFVVEVQQDNSGFEVYAKLPGHQLNCTLPVAKNHQYRYRVVATSCGLCNVSHPSVGIIGGPGFLLSGPPTNLRVTNEDIYSISLSWDMPTLDLFAIYWSTDCEQVQCLQFQSRRLYFRKQKTYTVKNLNPNQAYYFCVSANGLIETICSNVVNGTTLSVNLTSVKMVTVSSGGLRTLTVKWKEPVLPAGLVVYQYYAYYQQGNKFNSTTANVTICTESPCTLSDGIQGLEQYTVAVGYVVIKEGSSYDAWSLAGELSSPVTVTTPPDAQSVTLICAPCKAISGSTVKVQWLVKGVDVSFADMDMRLLISDSFTHSLVKNITLNSTSYTMTGLHPGIAYRFSLQLQDSRGHTGNRSLCHPCLTKEIAPSAAPSFISTVDGNSGSVNISWGPIPTESQGGNLVYEVHIKSNQCTEAQLQGCQWCAGGQEILETTPSLSISVYLDPRQKYQIRVRGVTGSGTLYGPYSQPHCFKTPDKVPDKAPDVESTAVLDQAVCVEWSPLSNQISHILGYMVGVDWGVPSTPSTHNHTVYNATSEETHFLVPADTRGDLEYNITVRGFSSAGPGPKSNSISLSHKKVKQSPLPVNISVVTSVSDPCGSVTLHWTTLPNNTCGWYSTVISYYPAAGGTRHTLAPNSSLHSADIPTSSLDKDASYIAEVKVSFSLFGGQVMYESTATARMNIPNCPSDTQVNIVAVVGAVIAFLTLIVVIFIVILIIYQMKCRSRSLRDMPRSRERIRRRLNPYIDYPQHRGNRYQPSELSSETDFDFNYNDRTVLLDDNASSHSGLSRFDDLSSNSSSNSEDSKYLLSRLQSTGVGIESTKSQSQISVHDYHSADSINREPTSSQTSSPLQSQLNVHLSPFVGSSLQQIEQLVALDSVVAVHTNCNPETGVLEESVQSVEESDFTLNTEPLRLSPEGESDFSGFPNVNVN